MAARALRISARLAAALGFLSISLTGEIAPIWIGFIWAAWIASFLFDRRPAFQARLRKFETVAVIAMVSLLAADIFVFQNTLFIAVTHFLLFFQIVKLAGEKTRKDNLQIFVFSFFQILAACTLSADAWHAAVLLLFLPTATAALFWSQLERERMEFGYEPDAATDQRYRRMAASICAAALPINVLLTAAVFIIFPRLSINAALPGFGGQGMGYIDQVNLAQTGSLKQDDTVALWLAFPRSADRQAWNGYLRGDVMSVFDGRRWSVSTEGHVRLLAPDSNGVFFIRQADPSVPFIRESITLTDPSAATLFTSGKPLRVLAPLPALQENAAGTLHWTAAWRHPLHYEIVAQQNSDQDVHPDELELPAVPLQRVADLTKQAAGRGTALAQAQTLERFLKEHYRYSTDYGDKVSKNPVETFLFDRRQGACGHFASALALMLRLQHIPSRVIAGYYKGEWNEPAQCVVVRQRDAHAWVEAYIKGSGWIALDPTPVPPSGSGVSERAAHWVQQYWDYLSYQWNRLVIQYDLYAQVKAIETIKGTWWPRVQFHLWGAKTNKTAHWGLSPMSCLKRLFEVAVCFGLGIAAYVLFWRPRGQQDLAPIRFYSQFLDQMARAGHPKNPAETGWEYADRLLKINTAPLPVREITRQYYEIRFGLKTSSK